MPETKIEWCEYTFNPWEGCAKVSPGCANCYADALAVQALYATAGQSGSHRIVSALRAVEAWIREGGAL